MGKPAKHKRKGPKSSRRGCLMCKPHKRQGVDAPRPQEARARISEDEFLEEEALRVWRSRPVCPGYTWAAEVITFPLLDSTLRHEVNGEQPDPPAGRTGVIIPLIPVTRA